MKQLKEEACNSNLIKEMFHTPNLIRQFDDEIVTYVFNKIKDFPVLMITGEGSSRIFPANNMVFHRMQLNKGPTIITENASDLLNMNLADMAIIGSSNSGRTKELISLFKSLSCKGQNNIYGLTCTKNSLFTECTKEVIELNTGSELAVAATKTVVAQALFLDMLLSCWSLQKPNKITLADDIEKALLNPIDPDIIRTLAKADHIFFAGINNGVAEELTLKTNEIIRKKSAFFPGTYLLHGVEEVISENDVIILVDYLPDHVEKIKKFLVDNIGVKIITFSDQQNIFPAVPLTCNNPLWLPYIKLVAGWKILAETGIYLGIDIDKPERARKIGNEYNSLSF